MVVLVPEHLAHILRAGWTKNEVRQFLHEATQRPMDFWKARPDSGKNDFREGIGLSGVTASPYDFLDSACRRQRGRILGFPGFMGQ